MSTSSTTVDIGQFVPLITLAVQNEQELAKHLPLQVVEDQVTSRLSTMVGIGMLTESEAAILQAALQGNHPTTPPPYLTPTGSPSLGGFLYSAINQVSAAMATNGDLDTSQRALAILSGAQIGSATAGGSTGAIVGALIGGALETQPASRRAPEGSHLA
jgi:hypothetical protein